MTVALTVRTLSGWAPAFRALLAPVTGTPTLPAAALMGLIMQLRHFEWSPSSEAQRSVRWRWAWSDDHPCVSISEGLVKTGPLHMIPDGADGLFNTELGSYQLPLLPSYVVQLLLDLVLELQLFAKA